MKKILASLLALLMLLGVVGCTNTSVDDTTATTTEASTPVLLFDSTNTAYRIVIPKECGSELKSISTDLMTAVSEVTGKKPTRVYDNTDKTPETECEVLLGLTTRTASQNALGNLNAGEYDIHFEGKKLVILAANDVLLRLAVEELIASFTKDGTNVTVSSNLSVKKTATDKTIALTENGAFRFRIVAQAGINNDVQSAVYDMSSALKKALNCTKITVALDTSTEETAGTPEILVGTTNRQDSSDVREALTHNGYLITLKNGNICIVATDDDSLAKGVKALSDLLCDAADDVAAGEPCIANTLSKDYYYETAEEKEIRLIEEAVEKANDMTTHRILVVSDTHYCDKMWYGMTAKHRMAKLKQDLLDEYEKEPYEMILFVGDYSLDFWAWQTKGSWLTKGVCDTANFIDLVCKDLNVPYIMLPGNHEQYGNAKWNEITGNDRQVSFVVGDYVFLCWDSYAADLDPTVHSDGTYTGMDVDWVKGEMAKYSDKKFIFATHWIDVSKESAEAKKILDDDRVICAFAGHNHLANVTTLVSESNLLYTGNYSYAGSADAECQCYWGFRELYLTDNGVYSTYIIPENTYVIDGKTVTTTYHKTYPWKCEW